MKKMFELPSADVERSPIVEKCEGCEKVYEDICIAYADPSKIQRLGCALQSNKLVEEEKSKKVNPLKASKRRNRK